MKATWRCNAPRPVPAFPFESSEFQTRRRRLLWNYPSTPDTISALPLERAHGRFDLSRLGDQAGLPSFLLSRWEQFMIPFRRQVTLAVFSVLMAGVSCAADPDAEIAIQR